MAQTKRRLVCTRGAASSSRYSTQLQHMAGASRGQTPLRLAKIGLDSLCGKLGAAVRSVCSGRTQRE